MPHPIYEGDQSFVWDKIENIENELLVSKVVSTTQVMHHSRPVEDFPVIVPWMELVIHPDNPFMAKDYACHIMTHGSCDFQFTWGKDNPIPEEYTKNYSAYLKTIAPEEENTLEADFTEDGGYIRMYAEANGNVEEYSPFRPDWTLLADVRLNLHKKVFVNLCSETRVRKNVGHFVQRRTSWRHNPVKTYWYKNLFYFW